MRTGRQARVGPLLTPVPENQPIEDADVGSGTYFSKTAILLSQARGSASDLGLAFDEFTSVVVLLEPKGTAPPERANSANVVAGAVPPSVGVRHSNPGKVAGKVTGAGTTAVGAAVYLTGRALSTPLLVTTTDAEGNFLFRTVNVGPYTLHVIPSGATAVAAQQDIEVRPQSTPQGMVGDSIFVNVALP